MFTEFGSHHFHIKSHPNVVDVLEIETFLLHLAKDENIYSSIHNHALMAFLFRLSNVLDIDPAVPTPNSST